MHKLKAFLIIIITAAFLLYYAVRDAKPKAASHLKSNSSRSLYQTNPRPTRTVTDKVEWQLINEDSVIVRER
jgi:hypothetical protein